MRNVLLSFILLVAGCCSLPDDAESALRDAISVNKGHMNDDSLSEDARLVAQDNYDFDYDVLYRAGCIDELPPEVRERKEARDAAREEAGQ